MCERAQEALKKLVMNILLVGRYHENGQWRFCVFDRNHEMGDWKFSVGERDKEVGDGDFSW